MPDGPAEAGYNAAMSVPRALATIALVLLVVTSVACGPASVAPGSAAASLSAAPSNSPSSSPQPSLAEAPSTPTIEPARSPEAEASASLTPAASTGAPSTPTAAPTSAPAAGPTAESTPKPTAKPTAKPTPKPTAKPTAAPERLAIEARDFLFAPSALRTSAGASFEIAFTNADAAIPHNVTIGSGGSLAFSGKLVTGPSSTTYAVPALAAGDYVLGCIVHPAMTAALTVR